MPFDPISLILVIGGFLAGVAFGYFWDAILDWAARVIARIIDAIDYAIEVTSDAIVFLVKEGRRFYQRVEVYARNLKNQRTRLLSEKKEIAPMDVPSDIAMELDRKMKIKVAQAAT